MENNLDDIAKKFESKGFFSRIHDMITGFKCPKFSRERKLAELELQRLQAPLIAVVAVTLTVISLCGVTAPEIPETDVEIEIDNPMPGLITELTPTPTPVKSPDTSVKPAQVDAVAFVDSPV